jgi:hypothetical protein
LETEVVVNGSSRSQPWVVWTVTALALYLGVAACLAALRGPGRQRQDYVKTLTRLRQDDSRWEHVVAALGMPDGTMTLGRFVTRDGVHVGVYWKFPEGTWWDMNERALIAEFDRTGLLVGLHDIALNVPNLTGSDALLGWIENFAVSPTGVAENELPWLAAQVQ